MDKPTVSSAQLSSTNTTGSKPVSLNNTAISAAKISVDAQLKANIQLQHLSQSLTAQLTLKQAAQLQPQVNQSSLSSPNVLALLTQQHVLLYIQSQIARSQLTLSPALTKQVSQWLLKNQIAASNQQTKGSAQAQSSSFSKFSTMPSPLASLLSQQLGLSTDELKLRLKTATMKLNTIEFSYLQGEPIVHIKTASLKSQVTPEQLQQTLQFLIPLGLGQESALLVKSANDDSSNGSDEDESNKNTFELTFNLDELGQLIIKVTLESFQLTTHCIYSNLALEQKVKHFWPKLTSRLDKLGFNTDSKFQLKPELELTTRQDKHTGLVNTKV